MPSYVTNDMSFAAYLSMNGVKLFSAQKMGKTYKFEFEGSLEVEQLKVKFVGSEAARFDAAVRNIKCILFGSRD